MSFSSTVSVIIPSYNRAATVGRAIESVVTQDYDDLEVLIIDDGSTDNTRDIVRRFSDTRIRYHFQPNRGIAAARNVGIALARGPWLAFLDSDDMWLPGKIRKQLHALTAAGAQLCFCAHVRRSHGETAGPFPCPLPKDSHDVMRQLLASGDSICTPSVVVDRAAVEAVGGFDETLVVAEDKDLWFRLAAAVQAVGVSEVLVVTHVSPNSSVALFDPLLRASADLRVLRGWHKTVSDPSIRRQVRRQMLAYYADSSQKCLAAGRRREAFLWGIRAARWGFSPLATKLALEAMIGPRAYAVLKHLWLFPYRGAREK